MKVGKSILNRIFEKNAPTVEFRHFWKQIIFEISQEVIRQKFFKNQFADLRASFCTYSQLNRTKIAFCAIFESGSNFVTRHGTRESSKQRFFPQVAVKRTKFLFRQIFQHTLSTISKWCLYMSKIFPPAVD